MNKKQKNELDKILAGIFIFIGLFVWYKFFSDNWILFFVVIFVGSILPTLIIRMIPDKQSKKSTSKKSTKTTSKSTTKKHLNEKELLTADINSLSGEDFERLCFMYFKDKGYNPKIIGGSGDHGVDLVMKDPKDGLQIAVQCKRWKDKNVGNGDIIKLDGGKRFYKCPKTLFITTSNYTDKAREYATQCNVDLWNGLVVENSIGKWRKEKLKKIG